MSTRDSTRKFMYTERSVRRDAVRDARTWYWQLWPPLWPFFLRKAAQPTMEESESCQYERTLTEAAEHDIGTLVREWAIADQKLKPAYCQALKERDDAKSAFQREGVEAEYQKPIFERAQAAFHELAPPGLSHSWMVLWLAVIGIAEFPINALVFEVLGEEQLQTYLMAAGLGVVIPLFAHFFAKSLKQTSKSATDKVLIVASPLVLLGLLAFIGVFRGRYLAASEMTTELDLKIGTTEATLLFVLVNLTFFFVAVLVSYAGSFTDKPEYERRKRTLAVARRALEKESSEAATAGGALEVSEKSLQEAKHRREKTFDEFVALARSLKENNDFYVQLYRSTNTSARLNGEVPPCFKLPVRAASIPTELTPEALDGSCSEASTGGRS